MIATCPDGNQLLKPISPPSLNKLQLVAVSGLLNIDGQIPVVNDLIFFSM